MRNVLTYSVILLCAILVAYISSNHIETNVSLLSKEGPVFSAFIDNFLITLFLSLGMLALAWLRKRFTSAPSHNITTILTTVLGATICFTLVAVAYTVYEQFRPIDQPRKLLLLAWLLPMLIPYAVTFFTSITAKRILAIQGLVLITYIISLDTAYHTSHLKHPFGNVEQSAYHWHAHRQAAKNFNRSPLSYINEVKQLANFIPTNSRFFLRTNTPAIILNLPYPFMPLMQSIIIVTIVVIQLTLKRPHSYANERLMMLIILISCKHSLS